VGYRPVGQIRMKATVEKRRDGNDGVYHAPTVAKFATVGFSLRLYRATTPSIAPESMVLPYGSPDLNNKATLEEAP
jgi:hypothetical protein